MAKRPAGLKRLNSENLARLGVERLADMLVEMADDDPIWKRRLKMELAAEVSEGDLAAEIDKRLITIAASKARVSWRKRPALIRDLVSVRRIIVDRLAPLDQRLALDRLIGWFSLFRGLVARVKDLKGELPDAFQAAAPELGELASSTWNAKLPIVESLATAVRARPAEWGRWLHAAGPTLDPRLASALLKALRDEGAATPTLRPVITRLADMAGDVDTWVEAFTPAQRKMPEVGAEIAMRLLAAGRTPEARKALDASQSKVRPAFVGGISSAPLDPAWDRARIAVLEAEGRKNEAQAARWERFERDLDAEALRDHIARLDDFEDVVALEKAFALAAAWPRFSAGLAFLMDWPALREAAAMIEDRASEIVRSHPQTEEWAARLEARHHESAETLRRRR